MQISVFSFTHFIAIKGTQGRMQLCLSEAHPALGPSLPSPQCPLITSKSSVNRCEVPPLQDRFCNVTVENDFAFTTWSTSAVAFVPKLWCQRDFAPCTAHSSACEGGRTSDVPFPVLGWDSPAARLLLARLNPSSPWNISCCQSQPRHWNLCACHQSFCT